MLSHVDENFFWPLKFWGPKLLGLYSGPTLYEANRVGSEADERSRLEVMWLGRRAGWI